MLGGITAFSKMKPLTSKQLQRIEKKKKKKAAFLEIAKLNDKDRKARAIVHRSRESAESSDTDGSSGRLSALDGPSRKRYKKDDGPLTDDLTELVEQTIPQISTLKDVEEVHCPQSEQVQVDCIQKTNTEEFSKPGKKKLSGEEFLKLKRDTRERKIRSKHLPRFRLRDMGENASLTVQEDIRSPVFFADIQHLLMCALIGQHSSYIPLRWCQLDKGSRLTHIVVLLVESFSTYDYLSHESSFLETSHIFGNRVEVITPLAYNENLIEEMVSVPLIELYRENLIKQYGSLEAAMKCCDDGYKVLRAVFPIKEPSDRDSTPLPPSDCFARTQLLMSPSQLLEQNYPLPLKGELQHRYSDYVLTKDLYQEVTVTSPMYGLDCEMCRTTSGDLELTRISVVDEQLQVVYENLVKPYNRITDYLTQFSGITKQLLSNVTVRLENVQQDLKSLLPSDAILVGQSLNFDLQSLKMIHPYVIDTSVIYNVTGDRFRKTKLSILSQKFLGEDIQVSRKGHCSIEDSSASMKLTQLKLANSIEFGDVVLSSRRTTEQNYEKHWNSQTQTQENHINSDNLKSAVTSHVKRVEKTAAIISSPTVMDEYSYNISQKINNLNCNGHTGSNKKTIQRFKEDTNDAIVNKACEVALEHSFTLAHVQLPTDNMAQDEATHHKLNHWCQIIWEHVALNGLCVVLFGGKKGGANGACFIQIKKPSPCVLTPKL